MHYKLHAGRGSNVENIQLWGTSAINATGNEYDNLLMGNNANNILRGGDGDDTLMGMYGNDTMFGGAGDDLYFVTSTGGRVYETTTTTSGVDTGGLDTVQSTVSFTLGAFLEVLWLRIGQNINGTGNGADNFLIGSDGNNILDGGGGADTMAGGLGNDTYIVTGADDEVYEDPDAGVDIVKSESSYTLPDNVENLTLTGTADANGTGNILDNILVGNSGINILTGGKGNDVYYINRLEDNVVENPGEGTDTVYASSTVAGLEFELSANMENLILTGTANINGAGNTGNNLLTGNSGRNTLEGLGGNDILNGGLGNDTLIGGTGDDQYWVNSAGDIVTELAGGGNDVINSTASYTLAVGCYCETLKLMGVLAINGTGNELNNTLIGNSKTNILSGLAGQDFLYGGLGNDTLTGGLDQDRFYFDTALNASSNRDTITDMKHGEDKIYLDDDIFTTLAGQVNLAAGNFRSSTTGTAGDGTDYILYNTATGALLYDADGNADGAAVQFATLTGSPDTISATDFMVVA